MTIDQWQALAEQLAEALRYAHPVGRRTSKSYDALAAYEAAQRDGADDAR